MTENIPFDYTIISRIVEPGSKVLDLGCGTGDLMKYLEEHNAAKVQGIELNEESIYACVAKGLSVFHSDIDSGLGSYPDGTFDYVILNQTLQEVKKVDFVMEESLRVAGKVIVGFPNFAHLEARCMLFFSGRSPITKSLPFRWHDTPNLRFLSIADFTEYCKGKKLAMEQSFYLGARAQVALLPNLFARNAVFVIAKNGRK